MYSDGNRIVQQAGERTAGGAYYEYHIVEEIGRDQTRLLESIEFQSAPIAEVGVQGVTNECLLAIVADRLQEFQHGSHPCDENLEALHHIRDALAALERRTAARKMRGVEGTKQE